MQRGVRIVADVSPGDTRTDVKEKIKEMTRNPVDKQLIKQLIPTSCEDTVWKNKGQN